MKKKIQRLIAARQLQPTPKELTDALLSFLRRKFYNLPGDEKSFAQDRRLLLKWVVLWPASWLNERAVTIHGDTYREIFFKVFLQADANRSEKIKYRPAWLAKVIQSHFKIHGEEYYTEAKSIRSLVDQTLLLTGKKYNAPDPVRKLAESLKILASFPPKKKSKKTSLKTQLNLF